MAPFYPSSSRVALDKEFTHMLDSCAYYHLLERIFPLELVTKINLDPVAPINWPFSSLWSVVGPSWLGDATVPNESPSYATAFCPAISKPYPASVHCKVFGKLSRRSLKIRLSVFLHIIA